MRSKQKFALAFVLAAGFILAGHDAFSRAISTYEVTGPTMLDTRPTSDLLLAAKQKYPSRLKDAATWRIKPVKKDA